VGSAASSLRASRALLVTLLGDAVEPQDGRGRDRSPRSRDTQRDTGPTLRRLLANDGPTLRRLLADEGGAPAGDPPTAINELDRGGERRCVKDLRRHGFARWLDVGLEELVPNAGAALEHGVHRRHLDPSAFEFGSVLWVAHLSEVDEHPFSAVE